MGFEKDFNTFGGVCGTLAGGAIGSAASYKVIEKVENLLEKLAYKRGKLSIWEKFMDPNGGTNGKGFAIAAGIAALTTLGCAYLGTKIGAKLDEQG